MATEKIAGNEVVILDGVPSVILKTTVGTQIAVPLAAFETLVVDTRRRLAAAVSQGDRVAKDNWITARPLTAQTYNVEGMQTPAGEKVVLSLDRGTPTEIAFLIEPTHARQIAEAILALLPSLQARPRQN